VARACAIRRGGAGPCWGDHFAGQIGTVDVNSKPNPVPIAVRGLPR